MDSLLFNVNKQSSSGGSGGGGGPRRIRPSKRSTATTGAGRQRKCRFCLSSSSSSSNDAKIATYTCSQCEAPFCSVQCFRSTTHRECSEHFYKKCVLDHLKHTKVNNEEQKQFVEMLKRNNPQAGTDQDVIDYLDLLKEDTEVLNNIDIDLFKDPALYSFCEKLLQSMFSTGVDDEHDDEEEEINDIMTDTTTTNTSTSSTMNLDTLWQSLPNDKQQEFIHLVEHNEKLFDRLLNCWTPWWERVEWQRTIEEEDGEMKQDSMDNDNRDNDDEDELENMLKEIEGEHYVPRRKYPLMCTRFERMSKLTSQPPSPTIAYAVLCTIFAYTYLCRLYNGEIACADDPDDSHDGGGSEKYDKQQWTIDIFNELLQLCPFLQPPSSQSSTDVPSPPPENATQAIQLSLTRLFTITNTITDVAKLSKVKQIAIQTLVDLRTIFDYIDQPGRVLLIRDNNDKKMEQVTSSSSSTTTTTTTWRAPKAILLVLSDLILILGHIRKGCLMKNAPMSSRQQQQQIKNRRKQIELIRHKLRFYLSWTIEYGSVLLANEQLLPAILQTIQLEIEQLKQENVSFQQEMDQTEKMIKEEEAEEEKNRSSGRKSSKPKVKFVTIDETPSQSPSLSSSIESEQLTNHKPLIEEMN